MHSNRIPDFILEEVPDEYIANDRPDLNKREYPFGLSERQDATGHIKSILIPLIDQISEYSACGNECGRAAHGTLGPTHARW